MSIVDRARTRARCLLNSGLLVVLGLALVSGWAAYARSSMLDPVIFSYNGAGHGPRTSDIWFDGDIPKTFYLMTDVAATQHNAAEHPWISFISYTPAAVLRWVGLSPLESVIATYAGASGLWSILLFALLLLCGLRTLDALLFAMLGTTSASAMFWMPAPDSFLFGSITVCAALCLTKWPAEGNAFIRHSLINVVSLSMTVTNWMVGLLVSYRTLPLRDAWLAATTAWFIVCAFCVAQTMIFPKSQFFTTALATVQSFTYAPTPTRMAAVLQSFISHTVVMPEISIISEGEIGRLSVQYAQAGSGSIAGMIATIAWVSLLTLGIWNLRRLPWSSLIVSCGILVVGQLGLHILHGPETFLYSMHFLPLLVVVAAGATQTKFRSTAIALALTVVIFGSLNNWWQFSKGIDFVAETGVRARALVPR
jgi:hypothetical protein